MSKFHKLKIERTFADKKLVGDKPWEWRVDDRGFCAGDLISYSVNSCPDHTLNKMIFQIIYVLKIDEKHCVFTDRRLEAAEMEERADIQETGTETVKSLDGHELSDAEKGVIRILRRCKVETMWNCPFAYSERINKLDVCEHGVLFRFESDDEASEFGDLADDVIAEAEERREEGEPSW